MMFGTSYQDDSEGTTEKAESRNAENAEKNEASGQAGENGGRERPEFFAAFSLFRGGLGEFRVSPSF